MWQFRFWTRASPVPTFFPGDLVGQTSPPSHNSISIIRVPAVTELSVTLPGVVGTHDLCFTFTRSGVDPIWAVGSVELVRAGDVALG